MQHSSTGRSGDPSGVVRRPVRGGTEALRGSRGASNGAQTPELARARTRTGRSAGVGRRYQPIVIAIATSRSFAHCARIASAASGVGAPAQCRRRNSSRRSRWVCSVRSAGASANACGPDARSGRLRESPVMGESLGGLDDVALAPGAGAVALVGESPVFGVRAEVGGY